MTKNLLLISPGSQWAGRCLAWLFLLALAPVGAWAQSVASYVPARTTGNTYASISGTGNSFSGWRNSFNTDDNLSTATPIGFVFAYNGVSYSQFSVSTNGFLTFNTGTAATGSSGAYGFFNSTFSTAGSTVTTLAPFYDDQQTASNLSTQADLNASLKYLTTGTVGNRVLTAEWIGMQDFATSSTSNFSYQVKLYEADGRIECNYGAMTYSGTTTTMSYSLGINSATGGATAAHLLTLQTANTNTFGSTASDALGGTTAANMPAAGSRYSFTAPQPASPTTLTFSSVAITSMTVNFVDNSTTENNFQVVFSSDPTFATFSFGTITSTTKATTGTAYLANLTGLQANTTYYVRVLSVAEANSVALTGSQATLPGFAFGPGPYTIDNAAATNNGTGGTNFNNFTDAINTLNTGTVSGPLTFNVAAGQTFVEVPPALTKTGTAANPITFVKNGAGANPVIAPALNSGSGTVDYIMGLFGADYITFDGINLSDAFSAAGTTAGQREVGYFIGPNSTTDGAQNNVIRNCTIALNGGGSTTVNTGSIGIFVSDNLTVAANATTAPNSLNKIYGNTITGPVTGIFLSGYSVTTAANQSTGNEVGTTAGNTITANGGATSAYGVRVDYQTGAKTENNTVTVTNSAASTAAVRGIGYGASSSTGINGAVLINNNTVTLTLPGTPTTAYGIVQGGGSTPTGVTITNNKVLGSVLSGATGAVNWIEDDFTVAAGTTTITGNQITGNTAATTGAMSCLYRVGANGTANISGNYVGVTSVGTASANILTGAGGTFYGIRATSGTVTVSGNYVQNNALNNTSATTAATLYGYYNVGTPTAETVTGNTFTNLSIGGASTAATHVLVGIQVGANSTTKTVSGNTVGALTLGTSGGTMSGTVTGINQLQGTTIGLNQNKVYGLTAYGTSGAVTGIALGSGTTLNVANNLVGTLTAPAALSLVAVSGITVTSGTTANVYHNSVYLNASSAGATFGTSGIYLNSTTTNLDLRGNLVVNTSTAAGTGGYTAALRRTGGTANVSPINLLTSSDYNLYNVGTPSATNLLYVEGSATATNPIQTLAAYKALMATGTGNAAKEANAKTETVAPASLFGSTAGTASTFLHINPATTTRVESGGTTTPVAATDFDGQTRGAYPLAGQANGGGTASDIGADEGDFTPPQTVDVGATVLTAPASTQGCYTTAETVTVSVRNFNSTAIVLSGTVQVTVSGTLTSTAPGFTTITLPTQTISSGTIAGNGTLPVTFPGTYDLSAVGTYTFNLTATITGDADGTNNALPGTANVRTVSPLTAGTASATTAATCGPTTATLALTGTAGGNVQWQSSPDNVTFADITAATTNPYTTVLLAQTTYFKAVVSCVSSATSNAVTVTVTNPTITAANTPVTRCGPGNVTLTATSTGGSTPQYYTAATGGTAVASGASATVSVTGSTTYYVGARDNGSSTETAGRTTFVTQAGTIPSSYGLVFTANSAFTLTSVDVFRNSASAGTITVQLQDNAGTLIAGQTYTGTVTAGTIGTAFTLPLNFSVPVGTGLRLIATTGTADLVRESFIGGFPYNSSGGTVNITSGYIGGTTTTYYYFYNWQISKACEPATRTAIAVNVTTAPTLTYTGSSTICNGGSTVLTFSPGSYTTLTVSPTTAAAVDNVAHTVTFNPTTTTAYTITGNDGTGPAGCTATATATITVNPVPNAPTLTPGAPTAICAGSSTTATATNTGGGLSTIILAPATFDSGANGFVTTPAGNTSVSTGFARKAAPVSLGTAGTATNGPDNNATGSFYVADSDVLGTSFTSTLVSPVFSTVNYTSASLNFQQYFRYNLGETAAVEYSLNGTLWTSLATYTATQGAASGVQALTALSLPGAALGQATVQIRFRYVASNNWYWAIDNVGVTGTLAPTYAVLPAAGATVSGSTIAFSPTTTTTYQVTTSYAAGCPGPATSITITVNPAATANAGTAPAGVCASGTYSTTGSYGGSATSAAYTSSGTGTFSNGGVINGTTPSVTYSPSAADITAGSITLTLTTAGPCAAVTATLPLAINSTTTYTGAAPGDGSNWFNAANWSACVPSATVDATIPAGLTDYPALTTTATAEVRTLTIASGGSLAQSAGILNVYGNLSNSGTADLAGGTVALLGTSPTVTGLSMFYALEVNLASGTAQLSNATSISNQLKMTQGVLNTNSYTLTLLIGSTLVETDNSYLLGTVSVPDRTLTAGTAENFSGIGLVLTPAVGSTSPGATPVVRTTGTALTGVGTSVSIKRYFDIQPAVNTGLNVNMDFSYLNHELNAIPSSNLALFKTVTTTSGPWANQSPVTVVGTTISKTGIADFSIWTLGNSAAPLPVELTRFEATRSGRDAALAWATASEKSSRGFEVQVSTDSRSYRVLGFVASPTAASTAPREYAYLDREAGKAGLRYYRLRQLDLDGTATFSPVRTLRFEGQQARSFTAAPNPFHERLTLTVELPAGLVAAPAQLSLTDVAGRILLTQRTPALPAGLSQLELADLAPLASGVYIVHLAVPGQPVQHLKVVKE